MKNHKDWDSRALSPSQIQSPLHSTSIQPLLVNRKPQGLNVKEEEDYYTSNLSNAFQRAELETQKAEQLLSHWRNNEGQNNTKAIKKSVNATTIMENKSYQNERNHNKENHNEKNQRNDIKASQNSQLDPFLMQQEQIQQFHKLNNPKFQNQVLASNLDNSSFEKDYGSLQSNYDFQTHNYPVEKKLQPQVMISSSYSTFQNQAGQTNSDTLDQVYSTVNSNSYQQHLQANNFHQQQPPLKQLQYQSLQYHQDLEYGAQNNENFDYTNIDISGKEFELKQHQHFKNIPHQKLRPQIHNISQTTQQESINYQGYGQSVSNQNFRNPSSSLLQNDSIFKESMNENQQHLTTRTPSISSYQQKLVPFNSKQKTNQNLDLKGHLQTLQINNASTLSPTAAPSQQTLQPAPQDLVNLEYENEILQLDKHYRSLLKSEREEFERKLTRTQQQAEKQAEKKIKGQLRELREKVEEYEGLQSQVDRLKSANERLTRENEQLDKAKKKSNAKCGSLEEQLKVVQKKLDDMWERHKAEKDNAKLMTKFEVETESRKTINDLTMKIIELEKQMNDKDYDKDRLSKLLDRTRLEAQQTEQSFSRYLQNKSQDQILECENQLLKSQNRQLQDQLQVIELELADKNKKLTSICGSEKLLNDKYESLKKKFAITVKEKEQLEQNRLQETAKFKDLMTGEKSGQNTSKYAEQVQISEFKQECKRCEKFEKAITELGDSYHNALNKLRVDIQAVKQESRDYIQNCQREIHQTIIKKLRIYLDLIKKKENADQIGKTNEQKVPQSSANLAKIEKSDINFGKKKNSVILISKQNSQNLLTGEEEDRTKSSKPFMNQTNTTASKGSLTERGVDGHLLARKYTQTLDNINSQSAIDPLPVTHQNQRTLQEKSQILSQKLDQIQNTLLHKSIIAKSTQRTRRSNCNSNTFAATVSNPLTSMNTMNTSSQNDQASFNNLSCIKKSNANLGREKSFVHQNQSSNQIDQRMNTTAKSAVNNSYTLNNIFDSKAKRAETISYLEGREREIDQDYYQLNHSRKLSKSNVSTLLEQQIQKSKRNQSKGSKISKERRSLTRKERDAKNKVNKLNSSVENRERSLQGHDTAIVKPQSAKLRQKSQKSESRQKDQRKSQKKDKIVLGEAKIKQSSHSIVIPTVSQQPVHIGGSGHIASLRNKSHKFDF